MFGEFFVGVMTVFHVLVSVILIIVVLLQSQQSMNLSGLMGGASQSAMGSQSQSVLSKVTTVLAIAFFVTSIFFALYRDEGVLDAPAEAPQAPAEAPVEEEGVPAEEGEVPLEGAPGQEPPVEEEQPTEPPEQPGQVPQPSPEQ